MFDIITFFDSHSGFSTFISSLIVAIITAVYVYFSWLLLQESKKMRLLQNQPRVSITFEPEGDQINLIDLVIKNTGLGPAYDLYFELQSDFEILEDARLSEVGLIKNGLSHLGPQQEFRFLLAVLYSINKEKLKQPIFITVRYKDAANTPYSNTFVINLSVFSGMFSPNTHDHDLVDAMKDVKQEIGSIAWIMKRRELLENEKAKI